MAKWNCDIIILRPGDREKREGETVITSYLTRYDGPARIADKSGAFLLQAEGGVSFHGKAEIKIPFARNRNLLEQRYLDESDVVIVEREPDLYQRAEILHFNPSRKTILVGFTSGIENGLVDVLKDENGDPITDPSGNKIYTI